MIACIIPAYKPSLEGIVTFTSSILDECPELIPVVVNDGSGPEFDEVFSRLDPRVILLKHEVNRGKGRALKTAIEYVKNNIQDAEGAVTADADGQHRLKDIMAVVDELSKNPDALVLGGRRFDGDVPFRSKFGNALTRNVFAIASGRKVYDTQTGLRAFSRSKFDELLEIRGERYEYEMNMLLYLARDGTPIREITIETVYIDDNSASHFNPVKDSLKIYFCIFKFAFSSLAAFIIDYVAFMLLLSPLGKLFADIVARVISSSVNFIINKVVVFKSRENTLKAVIKYILLAAVILAMDYGLLVLFTDVCGLHEFLSKIIAGIILFFVNMIVQGRLVFRKKPATK